MMAASALQRGSRALRLVLNGYVSRPQYQARAFCKVPPDDTKLGEELNQSLPEKQQEQTDDKVVTDQKAVESLSEERLQMSQKSVETPTGEKPEQSLDKLVTPQVMEDHSRKEQQETIQKTELPHGEDRLDPKDKLPINVDKNDQPSDKFVTDHKAEKVVTVEEQVVMGASKEEHRATQEVKESPPEKKQETSDNKREAAQKKLHDLLTSLATADPIPVEPAVKLSRPKAHQKRKAKPDGEKQVKLQTEEPSVDPELISATKEVAKSLGGDVQATESELLSTLRSHSTDGSSDDKPSVDLSDLFVGMKVERRPSKPLNDVPRRKRYDRDTRQTSPKGDVEHQKTRPRVTGSIAARTQVRVDLFGGEPLEIFNAESVTHKDAIHSTTLTPVWEAAHRRDLQQCVSHPPDNVFKEMIQWTTQGKLWTFPIDNEVGLEEEKSVGFHEHVFLERHLEGWCPQRGPVRHFMELVCTGLSKNPYLTVERKHAHIQWYKNYFAEKEELLKEIGAIESSQQQL